MKLLGILKAVSVAVSLRIGYSGDIFFVTTGTGNIELTTLPDEVDRARTLQGHTGAIYSIKFDPQGKY